jgi:hypothetical protein
LIPSQNPIAGYILTIAHNQYLYSRKVLMAKL